MKYKKGKLYHIEWLDHASESVWQTKDEIKEWTSKNKPCVSEGRFAYETKDVIVMYLDSADDMVACTTMIYKRNIIKIKRL